MNKFGVFKSCLIIFQIPLWGWKQAHSKKWQNKNKNITLSDCAQLFTIWHIFEKNKICWTKLQCRIKFKTIQQVVTDAKQICVVFVSWTEQSSKKIHTTQTIESYKGPFLLSVYELSNPFNYKSMYGFCHYCFKACLYRPSSFLNR